MIRIEISPNDQKDILDLLDYALEKKKEDTDKEAYPKYWEIRIPQLKDLINEYEPYNNVIQSSLNGFTRIWGNNDIKEDIEFYSKVRKDK